MTPHLQSRLAGLQDLMREAGVDLTVVSVGPDLRYLSGYDTHPSERLTALVVRPDVDPVLIVPALEAPRASSAAAEVIAWSELEDPVALIGGMVDRPSRVAVGDHLWSAFLLRFQQEWPDAAWLPASTLVGPLRIRKDPSEIEALRFVAAAVDRVMARIPGEVRFSGRSEVEVARQIAAMCVEEGHETVDFTIVASGPNGASPHHTASDRIIQVGDLVVCDFGGQRGGYFSDTTRTFTVGEPSSMAREVHGVVAAAQQKGRETARPGVTCEEVDRATRQVIADAGYGDRFIHRTGHGIGLEVHENPYLVEGNRTVLEAGMAFSIEPGIYLPGDLGVRIEDIAVCSTDGLEALNNSDRGLVNVD